MLRRVPGTLDLPARMPNGAVRARMITTPAFRSVSNQEVGVVCP